MLRLRRLERGLTLGEVARALDVPVWWVIGAEAGREERAPIRVREAVLLLRRRAVRLER